MYELLSERDVFQGGEIIVFCDGTEMTVSRHGGWIGHFVGELGGWCFEWGVVAVLRPPKGE